MHQGDGEAREQLLGELEAARLRVAELEARETRVRDELTGLLKEAAEMRAIVDALPDLVFRLDRSGFFLDVKSRSQDVLARPAAEILGRNIRVAGLPQNLVDLHLENIEAAFCTGVVQTFEYRLEVPRGHREFEGRAVACAEDEVLLLIRDVTEAKQAIEEKRVLEKELHQARKMESIGRLAGGVAHNLNNLLTPIFSYAELLLDASLPSEDRREYLLTILKAAAGANELIEHLLAISHRQLPEIRRIDLRQVVGGFEKILRRAIRENIEIEIVRCATPVIIEADVFQIEQILLNLAINAQDAMPSSGRVVIETRVSVLDNAHPELEPGRYGALLVSDTGSGIDGAIRRQIFEPFFTTKGPGKGTGLGLSTVRAIVKQHGGDIRFESVDSGGTTFEILLPLDAKPGGSSSTIPKPEPAQVQGGIETVLVVEDHEMVSELVCRILTHHGYQVLTASSSEECLLLVEKHTGSIDLLLTDIVMPELNGPELYHRLLAMRPGIEVLYMSGYSADVIAGHGILEDRMRLIQKPFTVQGLLREVREALDVSRS